MFSEIAEIALVAARPGQFLKTSVIFKSLILLGPMRLPILILNSNTIGVSSTKSKITREYYLHDLKFDYEGLSARIKKFMVHMWKK